MTVLKTPWSKLIFVSKKNGEHHEKYLHWTAPSCILLWKYSELLVESLALFEQLFLQSRSPEKSTVVSAASRSGLLGTQGTQAVPGEVRGQGCPGPAHPSCPRTEQQVSSNPDRSALSLLLILYVYILLGDALRLRFVHLFSVSVHGWLWFMLMYFVESKLLQKPADAE